MIDRLNELGGLGKPFVFCLDYEMSELILLEDPLAQQELLFDIGGVTNLLAHSVSDTPAVLHATPISEEAYAERFAVIRHALERGDSSQRSDRTTMIRSVTHLPRLRIV